MMVPGAARPLVGTGRSAAPRRDLSHRKSHRGKSRGLGRQPPYLAWSDARRRKPTAADVFADTATVSCPVAHRDVALQVSPGALCGIPHPDRLAATRPYHPAMSERRSSESGFPIKAGLRRGRPPGGPGRSGWARRASSRTPGVSTRRCTPPGRGPCASTPASAPPPSPTRRYHQLLAAGTMGLSVAFDLPTQMGYDSDAPDRARRGRQGRGGHRLDRGHADRCSTASRWTRSPRR